ncbi:CU044_2847 family protein [Streptomyces sp. NPDC050619]|uniref:CU044_2847 family protein n=1 Tax=Streptomyces sp. NPDC050619 TaxID=3157214 RepID=UPI00342BF1F0
MGDVRLTFDDGSVVRLHLAPTREEVGGSTGTEPAKEPADELELPDGFGSARPVSVDGRTARALTRGGEALTQALRPLGGVLSGIHQSFAQFAQRPDEVTVEFGVTLGSDLSLGVFSGSGEASFTVSATWNLAGATDGTSVSGNGTTQAPPPAPVPDQVNGS